MEINHHISQNRYDITLNGTFTFNDHPAFRTVLEKIEGPDTQHITFHMAQVEFVDSAALGMMLLALDTANKHEKKISIHGASGQVRKMFEMSRFDRIFMMQ